MPPRDWSTIRHFVRSEWKNDPDLVDWDVVMLLDEQRNAAGRTHPHIIHVAWDATGHEPNSSHYTSTSQPFATGVDYHMKGWSLLRQWLHAERFPWAGIGVYPYWRQPGLHCDLRTLSREHPNLGKRWWRDRPTLAFPHGEYKPFNEELMELLLKPVVTDVR